MSALGSMVKKETIHIIRDLRTMLLALMMPLILLLLFGFAISTEVNNVRVTAATANHSDTTRHILERINANKWFTFQGLASPADAERLLRSGKTDIVLFIRETGGKPEYQIMADASNPTVARAMTGYLQGVIAGNAQKSPTVSHTLYNPEMKSAYNFVPGIMGMIFILICAIMTSVSIVREKETGTMDLLLISPVKPATIIIGKLVPYLILSCVLLAAMLSTAYSILGIPLSTNVIDVVAVSLLYIILSLSIGLLVSTIVNTQLSALIVSAIIFMLPVIMLSGMIFPVDNMPLPLQWISCIVPARWYTAAMRKLMIQQLSLSQAANEAMILAAMTVALLTLAIVKFNRSKQKA